MVRRELTSDEKSMCERAIQQLKKRNNIIAPKIKYYDYMLSEGLRINLDEKQQEFLDIKKQINEEVFENEQKIIILQSQVNEGVEVKETKLNDKPLCPHCGQEVKTEEN